MLPTEELAAATLGRYAALWIPRESNQAALVRDRDKLAGYLAAGGTLISFEEANQSWLRGLDWRQERVDIQDLWLADHPLVNGLERNEVTWHAHGTLLAPPGATVLIGTGDAAVLYLDEVTHAPGRVLAGTLDPDCHVGYGSDRPRALVRRLLDAVLVGTPDPAQLLRA